MNISEAIDLLKDTPFLSKISNMHTVDEAINTIERYVKDHEHKEKILTNEEHDYLKSVIAPFREVVSSIGKLDTGIDIFYDNQCHEVFLPLSFEYRGMEEGKNYTLLELGL